MSYRVVQTCIHYYTRCTALHKACWNPKSIDWLILLFTKTTRCFFLWSLGHVQVPESNKSRCKMPAAQLLLVLLIVLMALLRSDLKPRRHESPELLNTLNTSHHNLPFVRSVPCKFHDEARIHHPNFMW